ncbi:MULTISPECIES: hypothetical protein [Halomonadaceae]|jgi:hypothetical protein|uniref:hypothetical protein n=1 Tax=Halomonas sp. BMC7 TaxID=2920520 RepID=UPI001F10708E|nr:MULTISPECIES: hypothetical protein [Halomonas]MDI4638303.1 hypothetical protein [Halomonas sp. BMC7]|tara:strand:+ start:1104 stop:1352 length:249 start_codon:yes stop_codon:yes gene_type:complete
MLELIRVQTTLPVVFGQLGVTQRGHFTHGMEFVTSALAFGIIRLVGQQTTRFPGLIPPVVQRGRRDTFFLSYLRDRAVMGRE